MDEALDTADDARLKRITDSIERLKRDHGELATWRCKGGYIARTLTGLLLPQLERIAPTILQGVLGVEYAGNRGDYQRLVAMVVDELGQEA